MIKRNDLKTAVSPGAECSGRPQSMVQASSTPAQNFRAIF